MKKQAEMVVLRGVYLLSMLIRSRQSTAASAWDPDAHDETRKKGPPSQSTRNKLIQPEGGVNPIALECFSPWAGTAWKRIRGQRPELSQLSAAYYRKLIVSIPCQHCPSGQR